MVSRTTANMEECYLFSPLQGQVGKTAQNANFIGHEKFYRTSWEMELSPWMFNCSSLEKKKKKDLEMDFLILSSQHWCQFPHSKYFPNDPLLIGKRPRENVVFWMKQTKDWNRYVPFRQTYCCCLAGKSCRLFATPWTVAHQAPLSMGFLRQEYWSGQPFLSPVDPPNPGIEPASPVWQVDSLPLSHQGSPTSQT